jgi:hypothetical protein
MRDQARLLVENRRHELVVTSPTPAAPGNCGQRRKGFQLTPAQAAPQALHTAQGGDLAMKVPAGIFQPMAPGTPDGVAQVQIPSPAAASTLEPRPADSGDRLVPDDRNTGPVDPKVGRLPAKIDCAAAGQATPGGLEGQFGGRAFDEGSALQQVPDV